MNYVAVGREVWWVDGNERHMIAIMPNVVQADEYACQLNTKGERN